MSCKACVDLLTLLVASVFAPIRRSDCTMLTNPFFVALMRDVSSSYREGKKKKQNWSRWMFLGLCSCRKRDEKDNRSFLWRPVQGECVGEQVPYMLLSYYRRARGLGVGACFKEELYDSSVAVA